MIMVLRCFVVCDGEERGGKAKFLGGMSFFVACGDCFVVCEGEMKFAAFVLWVDEVVFRLAGGVLLLAGVAL
jgi:hypothetical protein